MVAVDNVRRDTIMMICMANAWRVVEHVALVSWHPIVCQQLPPLDVFHVILYQAEWADMCGGVNLFARMDIFAEMAVESFVHRVNVGHALPLFK
jgi:hypothetical protein